MYALYLKTLAVFTERRDQPFFFGPSFYIFFLPRTHLLFAGSLQSTRCLSNIDGEKFNLKLPAAVDECYAM
jgi:hypothetical protein